MRDNVRSDVRIDDGDVEQRNWGEAMADDGILIFVALRRFKESMMKMSFDYTSRTSSACQTLALKFTAWSTAPAYQATENAYP